jgi:CHAT domain-containing protein/tetratricopeptide (TPR) repeat protein
MSPQLPTAAESILMSAYTHLGVGALDDAQRELADALQRGVFGEEPSVNLVLALRMLAQATRKLGHLQRATAIYQEARRVAHELGKPDLESAAVEGLALVASFDGEPARALKLYDEAAALAEAGGDEIGRAAVLSNKGNLLVNQEQFEKAVPILREALSCKGLTPGQRAGFEDNMSIALAGQGELEEAIVVATRAAKLFERLGAGFDHYQVLCHLERYRRQLGHDEDAAKTFVEAHELIARVEAENLDIEHYRLYDERVRRIESETRRHLESEGAVALDIGLHAHIATDLGNRADLAFESGDYAAAETDLLNALGHWEQLKALHAIPRIHHALGMVYTETGQVERARGHLMMSREMAHQLGDAHRELSACTNLCRFVLDNPNDAGELDAPQLIARARALRPLVFNGEDGIEVGHELPIDGGVIDSLDAGICASHRAFDLAEAAACRAIETIEPVINQGGQYADLMRYRLGLRLVKLYSILRRRNEDGDAKERADALAIRLDEFMLGDPTPRTAFSVQATLGVEMFHNDNWDEEALKRLLGACDAYEEIREQALKVGELGDFAEAIRPPFPEAIEVSIHLGKPEEALHLLERSKSRSLLDALRASETELLEGLSGPPGDGSELAREGRQLTRPATAAELSAALASRTSDPLLVELFLGPRNVYAFTLDGRGELGTHHLGQSTRPEWIELGELVRKKSLAGAGSALETLSHPAVRTLSAFVQSAAGSRPVYLSPHGVLHALPLHLVDEGGVLTPRPRTYHLPSGSLLRIDSDRSATNGALVGGDPLGDLPYAALEAESVAERFDVLAVTGVHCTPEWLASALVKGHAPLRLVHLACHAVFHPSRGERSGVVLTDGNGPAVVSVRELSSLDWDGDLVVLSACSSGQQEVRAGDELAGISRTLLGRGARALIVALWEVPDLQTYLLIKRLYSQLPLEGDWSLQAIGDALAAAQRAVRDMRSRDLMDTALHLHEMGGHGEDLLRCAFSAAAIAHSSAGNQQEALSCVESLLALAEDREPAPDIGALQWDAQAQIAEAPAYEAKPFADPTNWAAFTLVGRR